MFTAIRYRLSAAEGREGTKNTIEVLYDVVQKGSWVM